MINPATPTYCANHPGVETGLSCNKCGKPICARCAIRTPIGYRCKECLRGQQKVFVTAEWIDYLLGFATAFILGLVASFLASLISRLSFIGWILIVIGSPTAGMIIAEALRRVTRKHRSHALFITISAAVVLSALPVITLHLLALDIFTLIFQGIYLFITVPVIYTRLSGIQLTR
jgi:hypothetical protein